jgi:uncharacterized caspase-like protein
LRNHFILVFALSMLTANAAYAEKRVALVIGNSAYQNVVQLTNPANDAAVITEMFKKANFEIVESRRDLKNIEMRRALREFTDKAHDADIAIVYYAGHGIEVDGTNYLIPIDAALQRDTDVYDEAISLDRILQAIEPAKQLRLVILDACRDNPFGKIMKRTLASRSVGRGLAGVEPSKPNTLIAFAAKGGSTAADGDSNNSPFSRALAKHLTSPGLDLRKALGLVRDDVMKATGNKQEPFVYGSLGGEDVALVPAVSMPRSPTSSSDPNTAVRRDYELALQISTIPVWNSFISNYPSGFYTDLAKAQRERIIAEAASIAATERAKATADEQKRLAVQGANATERAKAAVQAKAAEEVRIAAEKKRAIEEAKVADAERAAQAGAVEDARLIAKQSEAEKLAQEHNLGETKQVLEVIKSADAEHDKTTSDIQTAGLIPPAETPSPQAPPIVPEPHSESAMTTETQKELKRVGCYSGRLDGKWATTETKDSVENFARYAKLASTPTIPAADFLDAIKSKTDRICPLECGLKEVEKNGQCVKRREPGTASLEKPERKVSGMPSAIKRADQAEIAGTYQICMGARSGCYQRAMNKRTTEEARTWCSRRPTC